MGVYTNKRRTAWPQFKSTGRWCNEIETALSLFDLDERRSSTSPPAFVTFHPCASGALSDLIIMLHLRKTTGLARIDSTRLPRTVASQPTNSIDSCLGCPTHCSILLRIFLQQLPCFCLLFGINLFVCLQPPQFSQLVAYHLHTIDHLPSIFCHELGIPCHQ